MPVLTPISLRDTTANDLDYVLHTEHSEENRPYIFLWSRQQHLDAIANPDFAHLVFETTGEVPDQIGYAILSGLYDANQSICLGRIVISQKGKGYGKAALRLIQKLAFETYDAHRLWLDVKEYNHRAQAAYQSTGFIVEGKLRECLKVDKNYESLIVMSMLRQEYEQ
jgi:RimJ/RimL family protein N-acetyltransferase